MRTALVVFAVLLTCVQGAQACSFGSPVQSKKAMALSNEAQAGKKLSSDEELYVAEYRHESNLAQELAAFSFPYCKNLTDAERKKRESASSSCDMADCHRWTDKQLSERAPYEENGLRYSYSPEVRIATTQLINALVERWAKRDSI